MSKITTKTTRNNVIDIVHNSFQNALLDSNINYTKILCPVCKLCKICSKQTTTTNTTTTDPHNSLQTENNLNILLNSNKRIEINQRIKNNEINEKNLIINELNNKLYELKEILNENNLRIERLTYLNLQSYEELINEKNKVNKLILELDLNEKLINELKLKECDYQEKLMKIESSIKLSESCRSRTTKELTKYKSEVNQLRSELQNLKYYNNYIYKNNNNGFNMNKNNNNNVNVHHNNNNNINNSNKSKKIAWQDIQNHNNNNNNNLNSSSSSRSRSSHSQSQIIDQILTEEFDANKKSKEILSTIQNDLSSLIEVIHQWYVSFESVFLTQNNFEQELFSSLNGLCLSIDERIRLVTNIIETSSSSTTTTITTKG